jgi:hypothetical protein
MISEALITLHYIPWFCKKKYTDNIDVDKRWKEWIEFETSIISEVRKNESVHG